ncbi:acetyltransferase [Pengzhenrongella frigida]|uniref:Acetyltransferase n=1 Tax=Pengzhenrongella frigida TaxID=1259133 RepID=A0A4Q5N006_9MICO|nr:acetyltransferase [Cellulomonas sp. HLT2-17]RYV51349.1 acetyltransferase [Cellulomonas sp. HLT2-17]
MLDASSSDSGSADESDPLAGDLGALSPPLPVVVIGNGGHSRSCVDAWNPTSSFQPLGCTGFDPHERSEVAYLGTDDVLPGLLAQGYVRVFVALGDSRLRERCQRDAVKLGYVAHALVAGSAQVARTASIEAGAAVLRGAIVGAFSRVGEGAIINTGASIDHDCVIGPYAHIAPGTHLAGNVEVGAHSMLGVGTSVIPGVKIGAGAVIGAGSVVISDIPDGQAVAGVPARPLKRRN